MRDAPLGSIYVICMSNSSEMSRCFITDRGIWTHLDWCTHVSVEWLELALRSTGGYLTPQAWQLGPCKHYIMDWCIRVSHVTGALTTSTISANPLLLHTHSHKNSSSMHTLSSVRSQKCCRNTFNILWQHCIICTYRLVELQPNCMNDVVPLLHLIDDPAV